MDISSSYCGTVGTTVYPITKAVTADNSGYIVSTNSSSATGPVTVNARGGLKILTPGVGASTGAGSVSDANGNQISISSSGVITDTLNTTALTVTGNAPTNPPSCTPGVTYTYTAPSGTGANVIVNYLHYVVQTNFGQGISEFPATNECLVDNVELPDGSTYRFGYEATVGGSGTTTGRIASVTLPTGGVICYAYGGTPCTSATSNSMMADGSPATLIDKNEWGPQVSTYTRALQTGQSNPQQTTTKIVDYAGNETDLNFSGIYQTSRKAYQGSSSGTLLDSTTTCYDGNSSSCATATVNLAAYISQRDVYDSPGSGSQTSIFYYFYDQYGNLTYEGDNDYPNGATRLKTTSITLNSALCSASNICDHPASVEVLDGGSNEKSLTSYTYDGGSNTKGNATSISKWVSSTSSSLTWNYSYNTGAGQGGTLATATDPNGTVTSYSYNGSVCNGAFPTSVSVPSSWTGSNLTTNYSYNCTGGVVTSVTDPNGALTKASYGNDPYFWRPDSTTDALNNTTYYNYYGVSNNPGGSAATAIGQVESVMTFNSSPDS